ncbi:MAG: low temperature requirement protein A [Phormidesmis sp.]
MPPFRHHLLRLQHHQAYESDRHATWLELFFDLVFVLAIAELSHHLHSHLTWAGIAGFAALFIPIWWLWVDFSYFADQFDVEQGVYRLIILGVMFGLVVMALTISNALAGGSAQFAMAYAALRLVITFLYLQAWRFVPPSRELTKRYVISFAIALALWLISIATPTPVRFWLWALALLVEIGNGPITYLTIRNVPTHNSHMDERFGLFMIIALGEAIVAVAAGVSETNWDWQSVLTGAGGFLIAVNLWWTYFERVNESTINQALRGGKMALLRSFLYGYSHVLAFMGIAATSVGIQVAIESANGHAFSAEVRAVLCGGIAIFLIGVTTLQWASPGSLPQRVIRLRLGLALSSFAFIAGGANLSPAIVVLSLGAALIALNWLDGVPLYGGQLSKAE